jgi:hypothetical protein
MRRESVWERVPEVGRSQFGKRCQLRLGLAFGHVWGPFWMGKNVFRLYYTIKDILYHLFGYWGSGWDGCERGTLDDVCYL